MHITRYYTVAICISVISVFDFSNLSFCITGTAIDFTGHQKIPKNFRNVIVLVKL